MKKADVAAGLIMVQFELETEAREFCILTVIDSSEVSNDALDEFDDALDESYELVYEIH